MADEAVFEAERSVAADRIRSQGTIIKEEYGNAIRQNKHVPIRHVGDYLSRHQRLESVRNRQTIYGKNVKSYSATVNEHKGLAAVNPRQMKVVTSKHKTALAASVDLAHYRNYVDVYDNQPKDRSVKYALRTAATQSAGAYAKQSTALSQVNGDYPTMRKAALKTIRDMHFHEDRKAHAIKIGALRYLGTRQKDGGDRSLRGAVNLMSQEKKQAKRLAHQILYRSSIVSE